MISNRVHIKIHDSLMKLILRGLIFILFVILCGAFGDEQPSQPPATRPSAMVESQQMIENWLNLQSSVRSMVDPTQNHTLPPQIESSLTPTLMVTLAPHESRRPQASPTHAPTFVANSSISAEEYQALYDLYYGTNGPYWTWNGTLLNLPEFADFDYFDFPDTVPWDFSTYDLSKPCVDRWSGVNCSCSPPSLVDGDINCRVIGLSLPARNITGTLPEGILNLTSVTTLTLISNHLGTTIPQFLGKFPRLEVLDLAYNKFTGSIPKELGEITTLTKLFPFHNRLTGNIPELFFTNLKQLKVLQLSHNRLQGALSPNISKLIHLEYISIGNNSFGPTVPEGLNELKEMRILDLGINEFTGTLPLSVTKMDLLSELYLHSNYFTGTIPHQYGNFFRLSTMFVGNNHLTGTIPSSFIQLRRLRNFDCQYNQLHGNLSAIFLHRPHLFNLYIQHNAFTGPLFPSNGTQLVYKDLVTYSAYSNYLTGSIPIELANASFINFLDLGENLIYGTIPNWMSDLRHLTYFYLNDNAMSGTIPVDFGIKIIFLVELYLDHNMFTGTLPFSLGLLHLLVELNVHGNKFVGKIPNLLISSLRLRTAVLRENSLTGTLPNFGKFYGQSILQNLDVSDNGLTGTVPEDIYKLSSLETLVLSGNCFHGSISSEICNVKTLINLAMEGISTADACQKKLFPHIPYFDAFSSVTALTGTIPPCLFNMPSMISLYLSGNGLQGSLPYELPISPKLSSLSLSYNILSGSIPITVQERAWKSLDLSNNKFAGTISNNFYPWNSSNTSLSLEINRLSGAIPSQLWSTPSISMLDGNIFQCDLAETNLPQHDPSKSKYSCGSDSIDRSIYLWLCNCLVIGLLAVLIAYLFSKIRLRDVISSSTSATASAGQKEPEDTDAQPIQSVDNYDLSSKSFESDNKTFWQHVVRSSRYFRQVIAQLSQQASNYNNTTDQKDIAIGRFCKLLEIVRYLFLIITVFILWFLMPIYGALSVWESTYEYTYSWEISAILLSGQASGGMLCICFTLTTIIVIYLFQKRVFVFQKEMLMNKETMKGRKKAGSGDVSASESGGWEWLMKKRLRTSSDYDGNGDKIGGSSSVNSGRKSKEQEDVVDSTGEIDRDGARLVEVDIHGTPRSPNESTIGEDSIITESESMSLRETEEMIKNKAQQKKEQYERWNVRLATTAVGFLNFILMVFIDIVYVYVVIAANARQVLLVQFLLSIFKIAWNEVALWRMYPSTKMSIMKAFGTGGENLELNDRRTTSVAGDRPLSMSREFSNGAMDGDVDGQRTVSSTERTSSSWNLLSVFRSTTTTQQYTTYSNSDSLASTFQFSIDELNFLVYTVILNNVIIPCIAIAVVSSHCFYNAFFATPPTETTTIYGCQYVLSIGTQTACLGKETYTEEVTFNTPFIYRYECSAAFSIKFTAVYIFMFIIVGLLIPLIHVVTRVLYYRYRHQYLQGTLNNRFSKAIYLICRAILPNRFKRLAPNPPKIKNFKLLANDRSIVRYSSYLAILLSFGVLFPPLAVIAVISIYIVTYFEQFCIARILTDARKLGYGWYKAQIAKECENIPESWYDSLWLILPFACFSYACVIFDTLGDKYGWKTAAGPSIFVFSLPILFYSWQMVSKRFFNSKSFDTGVDNMHDSDKLMDTSDDADIFQTIFDAGTRGVQQLVSSYYPRDEKKEDGIELYNTRITMSDVPDAHQGFHAAHTQRSMIVNPMATECSNSSNE